MTKTQSPVLLIVGKSTNEDATQKYSKIFSRCYQESDVLFLGGERPGFLLPASMRVVVSDAVCYDDMFTAAEKRMQEFVRTACMADTHFFMCDGIDLAPAFEKQLHQHMMIYGYSYEQLVHVLQKKKYHTVVMYSDDVYEAGFLGCVHTGYPAVQWVRAGGAASCCGGIHRRLIMILRYVRDMVEGGCARLFGSLAISEGGVDGIYFDTLPTLLERLRPFFKELIQRGHTLVACGFSSRYHDVWSREGMRTADFCSQKLSLQAMRSRWQFMRRLCRGAVFADQPAYSFLWKLFMIRNGYELIATAQHIQNMIITVHPRVIFFSNRQTFGTIVGSVGRVLGIPTFWLQEASHFFEAEKRVINRHLIADHFCVWGESTRQALIAGGVDEAAIRITGAIAFEMLMNRHVPVVTTASASKTILLVSVYTNDHDYAQRTLHRDEKARIVKAIGEAASAIADSQLIIKPHPLDHDPGMDGRIMREVLSVDRYRVVSPQANLPELIATCDVLILLSPSTVGLYGVLYARPIIAAIDAAFRSFDPFLAADLALWVSPDGDIAQAIHSILDDVSYRETFLKKREAFLRDHIGLGGEGLPSQRTVDYIEKELCGA